MLRSRSARLDLDLAAACRRSRGASRCRSPRRPPGRGRRRRASSRRSPRPPRGRTPGPRRAGRRRIEPEAAARPSVACSRPGLQLDEVAVGIRRVAPGDVPAVGRRERDDLAEAAAAGGDDRVQRRGHVGHLERDVAPARTVDLGASRRLDRVVLVDLERRPRRAVAREAQVRAGQVRAGDPRRAPRGPGRGSRARAGRAPCRRAPCRRRRGAASPCP